MSKDLVGDWGSDLRDSDYACAIAALGVLESRGTQQHRPSSDPAAIVAALREELIDGERTPVWRGTVRPDAGFWRHTIHTDAAALAAAWRMYLDPAAPWRHRDRWIPIHARGLPRLALRAALRRYSDVVNLDEISRWLRHPDVQLSALVIEDEHQRGDEGTTYDASGFISDSLQYVRDAAWHWPLRVGVPEGAENAHILDALRRAQHDRPWVGQLSQCFTVGRGRDGCDLLIVTAAGANRLAEQMRARIRASMVVVLEDVPPSTSTSQERYSLIRNRVGAGATAAVDLPAKPLGDIEVWFRELVREISHDVPVHAAVTLATRFVTAPDPLIVGTPRAMDACRLLFIADRHDRIDAALAAQMRRRIGAIEAPIETEPTFGGPGGGGPTSLADVIRTEFFRSETVDGVRMLDEFALPRCSSMVWGCCCLDNRSV